MLNENTSTRLSPLRAAGAKIKRMLDEPETESTPKAQIGARLDEEMRRAGLRNKDVSALR